MKQRRIIVAVMAIAALTVAGEAFARGGGFGGGARPAGMAGSRQTSAAMTRSGGTGAMAGSHQGQQATTMRGSAQRQGTMTGPGAQGTMPTTTMDGSGNRRGQMSGAGSSTAAN